jgi:hypothetical protein
VAATPPAPAAAAPPESCCCGSGLPERSLLLRPRPKLQVPAGSPAAPVAPASAQSPEEGERDLAAAVLPRDASPYCSAAKEPPLLAAAAALPSALAAAEVVRVTPAVSPGDPPPVTPPPPSSSANTTEVRRLRPAPSLRSTLCRAPHLVPPALRAVASGDAGADVAAPAESAPDM